MGKHNKTLWRILSGRADANLSFEDLRGLLLSLEFKERIRGDHHILNHNGMLEILNLQPRNSGYKTLPSQASTRPNTQIQIGDTL